MNQSNESIIRHELHHESSINHEKRDTTSCFRGSSYAKCIISSLPPPWIRATSGLFALMVRPKLRRKKVCRFPTERNDPKRRQRVGLTLVWRDMRAEQRSS
jgi:hypothetical protein